MAMINCELIPDRITMGDIRKLHAKIKKDCKTVTDWKLTVKEFATEYSLTDQEAIAIARCKEV